MALASETGWQAAIAARGYLLHQEEAARAYVISEGDDPDALSEAAVDSHLDDYESSVAPAGVLSSLLPVDGAGSGLDADRLDGQHSSFFTGLIGALTVRIEDLEALTTTHSNELDELEAAVKVSTSFPGSPSDGDLCYRTDLADWFYYDDGRSKWLGLALIEYQGTYLGTLTDGYEWLDSPSIPYSATGGHIAPFDLCVVGGTAQVPVASTATWQLRDDGSSVATVSVSSATSVRDDTLNSATIAAGSVLSIYVAGTATGGNAAKFLARRVAS